MIPSPPGVNGRAPRKKDRIETVIIKFKERLIFRAKETNLRRITSRTQTPQDKKRTGINDFLNRFQFCCITFKRDTNFSRKTHVMIPAIKITMKSKWIVRKVKP